ncbi:MAG TPA: hypothetical protein VHX37_13495 [Acidobacteriaceae bacterium]|jgi:hypothetical protein|nr:hypothetical protein [Acidobacteriaceae bacterium]
MTTTATQTPAPPANFPPEIQEKWTDLHNKAFAQAMQDNGNNERNARIAAVKAANTLHRVTPPTSAAEIDDLYDWQVIRRETKTIKGVATRLCVTIDGRKYAFPVDAPAPKKGAKQQ